MEDNIVLSELFENMKQERQPYLDRAEQCAKHTIPYAFVEENFTGKDDLDRYFTQGYGSMLVKHLVGKLALSILPPSQPFFRLSPTQEALNAVAGGDTSKEFEIERILAQKEEAILRNVNKSNLRGSLYPALILSIITGNVFIEKTSVGYKVINLRNFVVERDYNGTITKFIINELIDKDNIPENITVDIEEGQEEFNLYTGVILQEDGNYTRFQEVEDVRVGTEETIENFSEYYIDASWSEINGEHYRRSFVEDYLGSFVNLEKLTVIMYEGLAEHVKIVKLVNPNGMTEYKDYVDAKHGDVIIGRMEDISSDDNKSQTDFQVIGNSIEQIKQELARAFLVAGASIRNSERTTAEEVSLVASEVEASLGGIYTSMADNVQRPTVLQAMKEVDLEESDDIDVIITTGVQALGRNVELSKINNLIQELQLLASIVGQEKVAMSLNVDALASAMVSNSGVASKNFLYSQAEKDQIEINQKRDNIEQQMLAGGLPQAGQNVANQMTGGQQ